MAPDTDTDLLDDELDPVDDLVTPRRGRTALVTALAVGAVLVALIVVLATGEPASSRLGDSPLLGQRAPELVGSSVLSGRDFDLDDERGRWVVVNFFATWCEPCRREHPDLVRFAAAHQEVGDARVVSVVFSDQVADVERFFAERGGSWPVIDDDSGIVPRWGVSNVPESYLVDPAGRVVAKIIGGTTFDGLEDLLDRAQGGPGSGDA